jgi:lactate permease
MLLTLFVFLWGLPQTKDMLGTTSVEFEVPGLHQVIARDRPVVAQRRVEDAIYRLDWLATTGTAIFLAAVLSAFWLRVPPHRFLTLFLLTCYRMRWPLFTIACMLAIAFTSRYSGMDATLGLAFTRTGALYPFFAALLGWLGVALTGSDTSSNALFGSLQTITADQLTVPGAALDHLTAGQARLLLATANSTGGVMGKMIDAQSIVVAAAATQQPGQEGPILRFVFGHSLLLAVLMGLLVLVQAYWWTAVIPD